MTETPGSGFPDPAQDPVQDPGGSPRPAGWPPRPDPDRYPPPPPPAHAQAPPPAAGPGPFAPPASPGPFAPPVTPGAFPPPPPGAATGQPAGMWGEPAPYGQPYPSYAPPPKKKRIWLRVLLGIVAAFVLLVLIGVVYDLVRSRHHLTIKPTAAGLQQVAPDQVSEGAINGGLNANGVQNLHHVVSAAYQDGDRQVAIIGADLGTFDNSDEGIDKAIAGLTSAGLTNVQSYPAGGGVHLKCGSFQSVAAACAWTDKDTFAFTIEPASDPAHLAAITSQMRIDLEAK